MDVFKKITIQIVLYVENENLVFKCLDTLSNFNIIILDNSANITLKEKILAKYKIKKYIIEKKNLGFSKGHNKASEFVLTEYLLILNADCLIDKTNIEYLINTHEKYSNCIISSPTTYDNNDQITYNGGLLPENGPRQPAIQIEGDISVQSVLGSAILIKKIDFQNIGGFDEKLFLFFSDDDLCRKFINNKKEIIQAYSSKAFHIHGISKVRNIFKRIFLRNYYMTLDELTYFYKINKHNELYRKNLKKLKNYIIKLILNFLILNFKKATYFFAKISAINSFRKYIKKN